MQPTYLQSLLNRRLKISQELEALDATRVGGLPDLTGEGETQHGEYFDRLLKQERHIQTLIDDEQARVDGPTEFRSSGRAI